jgi:alpha-tubulin suppressor-like RCC1 family protein
MVAAAPALAATATLRAEGAAHGVLLRTDGALVQWPTAGSGSSVVPWPARVGTATDWAQVACGAGHTLALKNDSGLWAWGLNGNGQLGMPTASLAVPTRVGTATDWSQVAGGRYHTLAIKTDGSLWAWGANAKLQLGLGPAAGTSDVNTPTRVGTDTDWKSVAAGAEHSLALRNDGSLWAWGDNSYGQLGIAATSADAPTRVGTDTSWAKIAAGDGASFAIRTDGTLWAWGANTNGQLGLLDFSNRANPTCVDPAIKWTSVACPVYAGVSGSYGYAHTVAIRSGGTLWACGCNEEGELGIGSFSYDDYPTFQQIGTSSNWEAVACGNETSFALDAKGAVWAWGHNYNGELGLGDTKGRYAPTTKGMSINDSAGPTTWCGGAVVTRVGAKTTLRYRASDAVSKSVMVTVTITKVKGGKTVKTILPRLCPAGRKMSTSFVCHLKRGIYRYAVNAVDASGNPQKNIAKAKLTVR